MEPSIFLAIANGNVDLAWILYIVTHVLLITAGMTAMMHFTYKVDREAIERWPNR